MFSERITRKKVLSNLATFVLTLSLFGISPQSAKAEVTYPYSVQKVGPEYRFFREDRQHLNRHFMSVITDDSQGSVLAIRPHPDGGASDNAWGSTLYLQPFLPGATLRETVVSQPIVDNVNDNSVNGISLSASGKVSRGTSQNFGDWTLNIKFSYINDSRIECNTAGRYSITLDDTLNTTIGDLNLFKIARSTDDTTRSKMILGTAYDQTRSQDPYADNVSITPLILKNAPEKIFNFDVSFESTMFRKNSATNWTTYE